MSTNPAAEPKLTNLKPPNANFEEDDLAKSIDHMYAIDERHRFSYHTSRYIVRIRPLPRLPPKDHTSEVLKDEVSMGNLDKLPPEILQEVLLVCDFTSLDLIRGVNSKGRSLVESLKPYRRIMAHAKDAIRILHKTQTLSFFSATHLSNLLSDETCVSCGFFGQYLFLLTGDRCCFWCLHNEPRFAVMTLSTAKIHFRLSQNILRSSCNILYSIPGNYSYTSRYPPPPPDRISRRRTEVVSTEQVRRLSQAIAPQNTSTRVSERAPPRNDAQRKFFQLHYVSVMNQKEAPFRGMAACAFPYLNPRTGQTVAEVYCRGCFLRFEECQTQGNALYMFAPTTDEYEGEYLCARRNRERAFSEESFLAHFHKCEHAQNVWRLQVEYTRRGGYGYNINW